jgi:hypothetical protein
VKIFGQTFKRTYAFPKDAAQVSLIWQRIKEAKIEYVIYKYSYVNPGLGWVTLSTSDTTYLLTHASLSDSSLLCVSAKDSVGNEGLRSDTVKVTFRSTAVTPPPVQPPSGTPDAPLADKTFKSPPWTIHGAEGIYNRGYDFGVGFYAFESIGPFPQYDCWLSRILNMPSGSWNIIVMAATRGTKDSLAISFGSMKATYKVQTKASYYDTLGYPITAQLMLTEAGPYLFKLDQKGDICIKSLRIERPGIPVDTTPPGKVYIINMIQK